MAGTKRRSSRQVAKRSIYAEPATDDDDFEFEYGRHRSNEHDDYHSDPPPPSAKRQKTAVRRKPQTRSIAKNKNTQQSLRSTFKIGKPRKPNSKTTHRPQKQDEEDGVFRGPSDGKIPDWTSLPLDILRDIFIFASLPVHNGVVRSDMARSASWLFRSALICRKFTQPALEAYYNSPTLHDSLHLHEFLSLLEAPKEKRYMNYNVKVRRLDVGVRGLAYVASGKPAFDLVALVRELPRLQHMEIHHPDHVAPFRPVKVGRWTFHPTLLFGAMDESKIRLKTWRWARNLIANDCFGKDLYGMMTIAHGKNMFAGLERLVVCGFNVSDSAEPTVEEQDTHTQPAPGLASSIAALPNLKDVTFITCDVIQSLQQLPTTLQRLELSNCLEITSEIMLAYFGTSASQLSELVLSHNAALSLSFLQALKTGCPQLEVLKIDLHYYSEKILTDDSDPLYDELLGAEEVPTWPPSLRHLEVLHAQKWKSEGAQNLLRSLIDSASDLPDLRHIAIHAHINIPWRDRVGFRDQWIKRLRRVFLRKSEEPSQHMGSLKQFRMWSDLQSKAMRPPRSNRDELSLDYSEASEDDVPLSSRRFCHVRVSPHKASGDTDHYSDSDVQEPKKHGPRRSKRVAETRVSQESTPVSDTEEDASKVGWRGPPELSVQGMCDVVDIRIDNQRPREEQYTEAHFLDSERSGDDDWHEGADEDGDEGYAW